MVSGVVSMVVSGTGSGRRSGSQARTPDETSGAGLGLAIVKGLVEAHHGQVEVRNVGPGCRFLVRLPG